MSPAMEASLQVRIGQYSDAGRKLLNQDFHGASIPAGTPLHSKGVAIALADGIGSSDVSDVAAAAAVHALLEDYYCTSDAWSTKRSIQCVIAASNSWLHAQTQRSPYRFDQDRGYVCTLSALVLKGATAHIFHVGDTRIYQVQGKSLEALTEDHRVELPGGESYLARALGVKSHIDIDYHSQPLQAGDVFVLCTDGVHEYVSSAAICHTVAEYADDLNNAARALVRMAIENGSPDNCTAQIVVVDAIAPESQYDIQQQRAGLRLPPLLQARDQFEGYEILRELHASYRSHVYLAKDQASGLPVVLKIPSTAQHNDNSYLDRFALEEWIAKRIDSPHVMRPAAVAPRPRQHLFVAMEYVPGQTLAQWLRDQPNPSLAQVRNIVGQIGRGLQALHRREMLHLDLRPENILIDENLNLKIIDFGTVRVAGLMEADSEQNAAIMGDLNYCAPECLLGEAPNSSTDLYALGVLCYQMLTGGLPYGMQAASLRKPADLKRLRYRSALDEERPIPAWLDAVLERAVHPHAHKRQQVISEFLHDLHHPSEEYLRRQRPPLLERTPLRFWQGLSVSLLVLLLICLWYLQRLH